MPGISSHITQLHKINTAEECCKDIKAAALDFQAKLRDTVSRAIDKKVEERGSRNASILDSLIKALEKRLVHYLD